MAACRFWQRKYITEKKGFTFVWASVVVSVIPLMVHTKVVCSRGWSSNGQHCYRRFPDIKTFWEARIICHGYGAIIATTKDKEEFEFVRAMKRNAFTWLGATMSMKGEWIWEDGTRLDGRRYSNWLKNEPNNFKRNEYCLTMKATGWNDESCSVSLDFFCKSKGPPSVLCTVESKPYLIFDLNVRAGWGTMEWTGIRAPVAVAVKWWRGERYSWATLGNSSDPKELNVVKNDRSSGNYSVTVNIKVDESPKGGRVECQHVGADYMDGSVCKYHVTRSPSNFTCTEKSESSSKSHFLCQADNYFHSENEAAMRCEFTETGPEGFKTYTVALTHQKIHVTNLRGNCSYARVFIKDGRYTFQPTALPWGSKATPIRMTIQINHCKSQPCRNKGICTNQLNSFRCICPIVFSGYLCQQVLVVKPFHNCPKFEEEFDTMTCKCQTNINVTGIEPPFFLSWDNGTPVTGGSVELSVVNITREQNGNEHTCRQTWAYDSSVKITTITMGVAYGPTNVSIEGPGTFSTEGYTSVVLKCVTDPVNPKPDYYWQGVNCVNGNNGPTCQWTPDVFSDTVKVITCRVSNPYFTNISETGKYTLYLKWSGKPAFQSLTVNKKEGAMVTVDKGARRVEMECQARGNPQPTIMVMRTDKAEQLTVVESLSISNETHLQRVSLLHPESDGLQCGPRVVGCDIRSYVCRAFNLKGNISKRVDLVIEGCICASQAAMEASVEARTLKTAGPIFAAILIASACLLVIMLVRTKLQSIIKKRLTGEAAKKNTGLDRMVDFLMAQMSPETLNRLLQEKECEDAGSYHSSDDDEVQDMKNLAQSLFGTLQMTMKLVKALETRGSTDLEASASERFSQKADRSPAAATDGRNVSETEKRNNLSDAQKGLWCEQAPGESQSSVDSYDDVNPTSESTQS